MKPTKGMENSTRWFEEIKKCSAEYSSILQVQSERLNVLRNLFCQPREKIEQAFSKYFYWYFRWCFESRSHIEDYFARWYWIFYLMQARGKRIMDIGCGFGINSILMAIYGASEVVCCDFNEEKISVFNKLLALFENSLKNIKICYSHAGNLSFAGDTFTLVLANDVISHVSDLDRCIHEVFRVLKPGGKFFIEDGNNLLYFPGRRSQEKYRRQREEGPVDLQSVRGTDSPFSYREVRKEIIRVRYPHISEKMLDFLSRKTRGLYGEEIILATDELLQTRHTHYRTMFPYRNPVTGEYQERSFNPIKLCSYIKNHGFQVQILPPALSYNFTRRRKFFKKTYLSVFNGFPEVSFFIFPYFRLLCTKDRETI